MSLHKLPWASFADVTIEAMLFSDRLILWCNSHAEFKEALKATNPDRFIALSHVTASHSQNKPKDQVIGFYIHDYLAEKFKQDFIVNVGGADDEFVLHTRLPKESEDLQGRYI